MSGQSIDLEFIGINTNILDKKFTNYDLKIIKKNLIRYIDSFNSKKIYGMSSRDPYRDPLRIVSKIDNMNQSANHYKGRIFSEPREFIDYLSDIKEEIKEFNLARFQEFVIRVTNEDKNGFLFNLLNNIFFKVGGFPNCKNDMDFKARYIFNNAFNLALGEYYCYNSIIQTKNPFEEQQINSIEEAEIIQIKAEFELSEYDYQSENAPKIFRSSTSYLTQKNRSFLIEIKDKFKISINKYKKITDIKIACNYKDYFHPLLRFIIFKSKKMRLPQDIQKFCINQIANLEKEVYHIYISDFLFKVEVDNETRSLNVIKEWKLSIENDGLRHFEFYWADFEETTQRISVLLSGYDNNDMFFVSTILTQEIKTIYLEIKKSEIIELKKQIDNLDRKYYHVEKFSNGNLGLLTINQSSVVMLFELDVNEFRLVDWMEFNLGKLIVEKKYESLLEEINRFFMRFDNYSDSYFLILNYLNYCYSNKVTINTDLTLMTLQKNEQGLPIVGQDFGKMYLFRVLSKEGLVQVGRKKCRSYLKEKENYDYEDDIELIDMQNKDGKLDGFKQLWKVNSWQVYYCWV